MRPAVHCTAAAEEVVMGQDKAPLVDPKSVTFWLGILGIAQAVLKLFGIDLQIPPEALIGATAIGLRRAVKSQ